MYNLINRQANSKWRIINAKRKTKGYYRYPKEIKRSKKRYKPWGGVANELRRSQIQRWKQIQGCRNCSQKYHYCQLQLDHIIPDPGKNKSAMRGNAPLNVIKEELSKCQVLCANCHAMKTWKEHKSQDG